MENGVLNKANFKIVYVAPMKVGPKPNRWLDSGVGGWVAGQAGWQVDRQAGMWVGGSAWSTQTMPLVPTP